MRLSRAGSRVSVQFALHGLGERGRTPSLEPASSARTRRMRRPWGTKIPRSEHLSAQNGGSPCCVFSRPAQGETERGSIQLRAPTLRVNA